MHRASSVKIPACQRCGVAMTFVGKLPGVQGRPEIQVFRCYGCKQIAAEETQRV